MIPKDCKRLAGVDPATERELHKRQPVARGRTGGRRDKK